MPPTSIQCDHRSTNTHQTSNDTASQICRPPATMSACLCMLISYQQLISSIRIQRASPFTIHCTSYQLYMSQIIYQRQILSTQYHYHHECQCQIMSTLCHFNILSSMLDLINMSASVRSYQHCASSTQFYQHDFSNVLDLINTSASVRSYQHFASSTQFHQRFQWRVRSYQHECQSRSYQHCALPT